MSREPGSIPVTCDICGVAVVVGADTPDTNLRRLGWDSTGEDDLCPMCKPRSLRALLMDVLGINVTGRYLDQAIVREVRALKLASEELSKQRISTFSFQVRQKTWRGCRCFLSSLRSGIRFSFLSKMLASTGGSGGIGNDQRRTTGRPLD